CFVKPRASEELFDTKADPQEMNNLAADPQYRSALEQLRATLDAWQRETADFVPSPRPPDGFDRETGKPLPAPPAAKTVGQPPTGAHPWVGFSGKRRHGRW